jgi:hypothetical protein
VSVPGANQKKRPIRTRDIEEWGEETCLFAIYNRDSPCCWICIFFSLSGLMVFSQLWFATDLED